MNNSISVILYDITVFVIKWYPYFFAASILLIIATKTLYVTKISELATGGWEVSFNSRITMTQLGSYKFNIVNNKLKRIYTNEEKYNKHVAIFIAILFFLALTFILGFIMSFKNKDITYYIKAFEFVVSGYIIFLSSFYIVIFPLKIYAKNIIKRYIRSN